MLAALVFQYPQALPWVILLEIILTTFVFLFYPRHLRRRWGWTLRALRILAVTAIAFSILRPVITRPRLATERPPVVMLLDNSRSMSVVDSGRPPAEWVGIAAATGLLPAQAHDKEIDAVQAACDQLSTQADEVARARAELDYAKLAGRGSEVAQTRLELAMRDLQLTAHEAATKAAEAGRANQLEKTLAYLKQIPVGVDRETWLDRVRDKARAAAINAEQLRLANDAELFRTDETIREACLPLQSKSRFDLGRQAEQKVVDRLGPETSVLQFALSDQLIPNPSPTLTADGISSNLNGGVRVLLESFQSAPPRAVVLFSDGRQVGGESSNIPPGIPIYTVGLAARGVRDLSIANVSVNSSAIVGEKITVAAEVRCFGIKASSTEIKITGGSPDESQHLMFLDDRPLPVSFDRIFSTAGLQDVMLQVDPLPGEASLENNIVHRWITVLPKGNHIANQKPATRPSSEAEMIDLTGDEGRLRRLAESSGGQFIRLDQVDLLPQKLQAIHDDGNHPIEIPLWDSPYLLCLVLGCLTAEWGLRKKLGLA